MATRARTNRSPALLVSALVHAGVVAATIIAWPWLSKPMRLGPVVPVTIITKAPPSDLAPAAEAPQTQEAMAPAPQPQAEPQPAPPLPEPPKPEASAPPKAATPPPKPSQAKPSPAKPEPDFFASLEKSLRRDRKPASSPPTNGQPGEARPPTRPDPSKDPGTGAQLSPSDLAGLQDKIGKLWNPNCQVEGASSFVIKVHVRLTPQGYLAAPAELPEKDAIMSSGNPVLIASAQRVLSAVGRGQPYRDVLRPEQYAQWRDMILKFNPRETCRG
jgi:protein TonB